MRTVILFLFLLGAAVCDVKTREIPNVFPALLAFVSLLNFEKALTGLICVGLPMLAAACISDHIGGGDVKLLTSAAMNLNAFYGILFAFTTLIISVIYTKITHKKSIPLAPFTCAGFIIIILIERIAAYV